VVPGAAVATTPTRAAGSPVSVPTAAAADPASAPVSAPTQKPVEVGFVIYPDVGAAAAALGSSAEVGDQRAEVIAAVGWVNAHGGLAGHRVVPVLFEVSLTCTLTYAQS
jgi:hypothetical protein